ITGDTLYVADLNGLHGFNTQTGEQLSYIDLTSFEPGFLNDVAAATNGDIYVTDTGQSRIYKISGDSASIATDSLEDPPNGITRDPKSGRLLIAPWDGSQVFRSFAADNITLQAFITTSTGGNFDGIEPYNNSFIVASQSDSSLYLISPDQHSKQLITTAPKPADIAIDTKRNRVAVPYISLNRVDIWEIKTGDNERPVPFGYPAIVCKSRNSGLKLLRDDIQKLACFFVKGFLKTTILYHMQKVIPHIHHFHHHGGPRR